MTSVYGNAPAGEHNAVLRTARPEKYPTGTRFIVGFVIVNDEGTEPICDDAGNPFFAVAVCNLANRTAKAKQFKIRRALLLANEFDPIGSVTKVPDWPHFIDKLPDGSYRCARIRVEQRTSENGRTVSVVTHFKRPRDGVWECIEGEFDELVLPSWLRADGTQKHLSADEQARMPPLDRTVYQYWTCSIPSNPRWTGPEGAFTPLAKGDVNGLSQHDRAMYEVARIKAVLARKRPSA